MSLARLIHSPDRLRAGARRRPTSPGARVRLRAGTLGDGLGDLRAARPPGRRSRAAARSRRAARAPRPSRPGRRAPSASPKRAIASAATGWLKRSAGGRVSAFSAPCGSAVAAAERLRQRVAEREERLAERRARVAGTARSSVARLEVVRVARPPAAATSPISRAPVERLGVGLGVVRPRRRAPRRSARARSAPCRPSRRAAARA